MRYLAQSTHEFCIQSSCIDFLRTNTKQDAISSVYVHIYRNVLNIGAPKPAQNFMQTKGKDELWHRYIK